MHSPRLYDRTLRATNGTSRSAYSPSRLVLIFLLIASQRASAQAVRGVAVDRADQPVAGVVLQLLDDTSAVVARTLSNDRGEFRLAAPTSGRFRIRSFRIGFSPTLGQPFELAPAGDRIARIVLTGLPVLLDPIRVTSRTTCSAQDRSSGEAFTVWEQAQGALTAAALSENDRTIIATTVDYDRRLNASGSRVVSQTVDTRTRPLALPWRSRSPDSLHQFGYVLPDTDDVSTIFYAPGLDALASPLFVGDHCFRLEPSGDSSHITLSFEPTAARRSISDLAGVLWLDRATLKLMKLEFRYTNNRAASANAAQLPAAAGAMEFVALPTGQWIIDRWHIDMPVIVTADRQTATLRGFSTQRTTSRIDGHQITGGVVIAVRRGGGTLWRHPDVRIGGTVVDSATGRPVRGAWLRVEGQRETITTDGAGAFTVPSIPLGNTLLIVGAPDLDSLGVATRVPLALTDSVSEVRIALPSARRLVARGATLIGAVRRDSTRAPIVDAQVSLPALGRTVRTDDDGEFHLAAIPPGEYEVTVRRVGFGPLATRIRFGAARVVDRTIYLTPMTLLDSVRVEESAAVLPGFDEHRHVGLGHFFTRADLQPFAGRPLSNVLAQIQGLRLVYDAKAHDYHAASARAETKSLTNSPICLAQVYVDGHPAFRGINSTDAPYNVNSLAPDQIEAIEFYAGPSQAPAEYSGLGSSCGVLVLWTRRTP